ncbi:DUF1822 family protein [Chamaesiphon sp. VAR_48_metabat_403]|uniref:DUF1822 family protein n=1 Tax=Chamaesiphon sp. VAR_48_metabat_403 TaxID=2964700 RepID=UPI00286DE699|nr:DUF1822 family protein [Chamaesiphon sp. VAR_48_metabat_403]
MISTNTLESQTIWLSLADRELLPTHSQTHSNVTAQENALINQLCLEKTQAWLTEIGIESTPTFLPAQMASMWDVVNGCALTIGNRRLILVPSDRLDREELRVPQEWVDIPNWMGDYYLGIQIDLEERLMNIWGYTSHRTLRETGTYNSLDRTYSISTDLTISNLDVLWMAQILDLQEMTIVPTLDSLNLDLSMNAIDRLSYVSAYSPRLDLDFTTWAAILSSNNLREQLYQRRLQIANLDLNQMQPMKLGDWLDREFSQAIGRGWDLFQHIMGSELALVRSMSIERAKLINLQYQLHQTNVIMLIGINPQVTDEMVISVQIHAAPNTPTLPPQLKLSYITDEGEELQAIISRSDDFQIQLPTFTCDVGTTFNIQLQLDGASHIEKFIA